MSSHDDDRVVLVSLSNLAAVGAGLSKRSLWLALSLFVLAFSLRLPGSPTGLKAADCEGSSTGIAPLSDLGATSYKGQPGGLYPGGVNGPPEAHADAALAAAERILPRDAAGQPDPAGRVILLSVGMSNTTQEYSTFQRLAAGDPQLHPALELVDGAQGGQTAADIREPDAQFWSVVDRRLAEVGMTPAQVQALWLKSANRQPGGDGNPDTLPAAVQLSDDIQGVVAVARTRFPNLGLIYLSSRIYAGYATTTLNPEPYAYESALALRWLIERQIDGGPELDPEGGAPLLLWGPYLWADGLNVRSDGLSWACEDFKADGTHPSDRGQAKVAGLLMHFFKTSPSSRSWFMADPDATPIPSPTPEPVGPTPRPRATRPPGTGTAGPPAGGLRSYRVVETPSSDRIWVSASDVQTQNRLNDFPANRVAWLCAPVRPEPAAEWGFTFDPDRVRLGLNVPGGSVATTIRDIAASPASAEGTQCIQIDGVDASVDGPPPGAIPSETPGPGPVEPTPTSPIGTAGLETPSTLAGAVYLPLLLAADEAMSR